MALPVDREMPLEKPVETSTTERSSFSSKQESSSHDVEAEPKADPLVPVRSVDDTVYPEGIKLVMILASLYIAVFLMALVSGLLKSINHKAANTSPGSDNHCYCGPANHERLQLLRRRWLVRQLVLAHIMRLSAVLRTRLYVLFTEMGLLVPHLHLRAWILGLRRRSQQHCVHNRTCYRRYRLGWHSDWGHRDSDVRCAPPQTSNVHWIRGCNFRYSISSRPIVGRRFHVQSHLEVRSKALMPCMKQH